VHNLRLKRMTAALRSLVKTGVVTCTKGPDGSLTFRPPVSLPVAGRWAIVDLGTGEWRGETQSGVGLIALGRFLDLDAGLVYAAWAEAGPT
jgi:hypothetical protein